MIVPQVITPLNEYQRVARYLTQTGRGYLTSRQNRRAEQKMRRRGCGDLIGSSTPEAVPDHPCAGGFSAGDIDHRGRQPALGEDL